MVPRARLHAESAQQSASSSGVVICTPELRGERKAASPMKAGSRREDAQLLGRAVIAWCLLTKTSLSTDNAVQLVVSAAMRSPLRRGVHHNTGAD